MQAEPYHWEAKVSLVPKSSPNSYTVMAFPMTLFGNQVAKRSGLLAAAKYQALLPTELRGVRAPL